MKEDYVSFEIAKLLKEKGFGGGCLSMYVTPKHRSGMGNPNEAKIAPHGRDSHYYEGYLYQCEAPTHQMAMKWLREVHHIIFVFKPSCFSGDECTYWTYERWCGDNFDGEVLSFKTYEEAVEAALKDSLENLI